MASAQILGLTSVTSPVLLLKQRWKPQRPYPSRRVAHSTIHRRILQMKIRCALHPFRQTNFKMSSRGVVPPWSCMKHDRHSKELLAGTGTRLKESDMLILRGGRGRARRKRMSLCMRHAPSYLPFLLSYRNNRSSLAIHSLAWHSSTTSRWRLLGAQINFGQMTPFISVKCFTSPYGPSQQVKRNLSPTPHEHGWNIRHTLFTPHLRSILKHFHPSAGPLRTGTRTLIWRQRHCRLQPFEPYPQVLQSLDAFHSPSCPFSHLPPLPPCHHQGIHHCVPNLNHHCRSRNLTTLVHYHPHFQVTQYE